MKERERETKRKWVVGGFVCFGAVCMLAHLKNAEDAHGDIMPCSLSEYSPCPLQTHTYISLAPYSPLPSLSLSPSHRSPSPQAVRNAEGRADPRPAACGAPACCPAARLRRTCVPMRGCASVLLSARPSRASGTPRSSLRL